MSLPPNRRGLPVLPIELLLEIIDSFAQVSPATPVQVLYRYPTPEKYLERRSVIGALSQTCRALRGRLLPVLWRDLQAFASDAHVFAKSWRGGWREWRKNVTKELTRQCEIVTFRSPDVAQYVETVTVALTDFATDAMSLFVHTLTRLPNLKTLHIVHLAYDCFTMLNVFGKWKFLTVKTMVLPLVPLSAGALLRSCPNVEHFVCGGRSTGAHSRRMESSFLGMLQDAFPNLRSLRGLDISDADDMTSLLTRCPRLEHLCILVRSTTDNVSDGADQTGSYPAVIAPLRNLQNLRSARIEFQITDIDFIVASLRAIKPMLKGPVPPKEERLEVRLPPNLEETAHDRLRKYIDHP
ncbi:hypothetical protein BD626DRAFT_488451 [Schizophyllum amplum]|uniref:F-box domain-containing protein n=1 Tax=Schizophyllum amplum TaxID=97359 RepID=A0A550CKN1_9AGAR|nr:hypothetical protein BD626DRAFT_488451 [Auriculariopsis ampla]